MKGNCELTGQRELNGLVSRLIRTASVDVKEKMEDVAERTGDRGEF